MRIFFYLLLILGTYGIIRGIIDFAMLSILHHKKKEVDTITSKKIYGDIVNYTAEYITIFGGALLFLWLL